ncbi:OmpA family protein [Lacinutrix sp. WUR7]|uniref:OmpA family protein n=1 Tax=Lacinutrix sp. WUR7 TaxID=2653681 RepID=UPI00193D7384|nr:OmpA family protein [Lacinutrix sp. WUR7]QRM89600.1 OmpA family protein [Lacinutrix sp. WUR7]
MKLYKLTLIAFFGFFISIGYAQKGKIKKANKDYDQFSYVKTSEILLEVAKEGYKSVDLFQKLGNSFYFNNKMEDAAKWYGELVALNEPLEAEYYFRYAQALKYSENYEESDKWMKKFNDSKSNDSRGRAFASTVDYLAKIEAASKDFEVTNMDFNSEVSDFGTTQYKDKLIFASSRGDGKIYQWNNQPFLDLYAVEKQEDGTYINVENYDETVNTPYHESTPSFTPDDQLMFFTRNNYTNKKLKRDSKDITRLKIYRARLQDDKTWGDIESVHFNSNQYSVAHPSINVYGTKLYFASDMPDTQGESDLYVVDINTDGTLGKPVNLGSKINTEGQETFPFINEKGDLFFSSNGYPGLGGLDVYVIRNFENKYESNSAIVVENIAKPINSPQDDFGYYENLGTNEGFFSSNRLNGKGDDDIYSFAAKETKCEQIVEGKVKDKNSRELIPQATVILFDKDGKEMQRLEVSEDAAFSFNLDCEEEYLVRAQKQDYASDEVRFTTPSTKQELDLELNLSKELREIVVGTDLAKVLDIPIIYFDFDKSDIRPDAALELQKVIAVMKQYPNMKIDVRSHTDSRAPYSYNESLSKRRNKSTIAHIIKVGLIDANRLTGNGYGERRLINRCSDGVPCTEEEHQLNRRSEFIVVSMD